MSYKSGFVTIIGRPNVGKSTLMNQIIGEKIAIMSDKPQTTRNKIQSVYSQEDFQIVFLDTPGIHKPKHKLGEYMVKVARDTLKEVDVVLFLVDEGQKIGPGDRFIMEQLKDIKTPMFLIINKIDKMNQEILNEVCGLFEETGLFQRIIPISALEGANIDTLIKQIVSFLPEGPQYFPSDMITDQPERLLVAEIVREKLLHYLDQEIPHGIAVETSMMKQRPNQDIVDIQATIYCEKKSHKGIIIGKGGRKLKGVGKSARQDIEKLLGSKVFLELWVKVNEDWRNQSRILKSLGYE
ncbi:GTP-binding protein Era [Alkaliphilus metalliredigens QYMF]|uniref:GTPase Era n=1 Tax=Alkaliphilus metalliredigens (strain QYMF) TaxID=293826 RepID=ERA_ALKMQ|nr:GTPase Era [Alkaliphilus metalliredigens]A6TSJ8.1 RecName: Full=GTPase Era [Alkaliphilus metalliredigens QYMF]ABR49166.1 GTP-binding protein Era [Alkaliphilus metalliredigens QYMF]